MTWEEDDVELGIAQASRCYLELYMDPSDTELGFRSGECWQVDSYHDTSIGIHAQRARPTGRENSAVCKPDQQPVMLN